MTQSIKTIALVAITAIVVGTAFSFRSLPQPHEVPVYEYMQFSTVESVIPGGLGRSRILTTDDNGQLLEKDLKNFYSMVGINFKNISNNDRQIVDRINFYAEEGWELMSVATGSHAQTSDGSSSGGLFISRYMFRRPKK